MNNGAYSKTYIFYIIQLKPKLEKELADGTTSVQDWSQSWVFLQKITVKIDFQKIELNLLVPRPCQYLPFFTSFYTRREGQEPGPLQTVEVYPY